MKILVTGGSGTIGGYVLRELLGAGHEIAEFSRSEPGIESVSFVCGDIMNAEQVGSACENQDVIVHMAAIPGPGRVPTAELMQVNVIGTVNVLEAAVRSGVRRVVFASSGAA